MLPRDVPKSVRKSVRKAVRKAVRKSVRKVARRLVFHPPPRNPAGVTMTDRRRGAVLVTVLWLIAVLSALAMAASSTFRSFAGLVVLDRHRVQAEALLTGGLEAAVHTVDILGDTPLDELETTISLSTGSVHAHL